MPTEYPNSYWKGTGKYQKEYEKLYSELVPPSGSADTLNGELIRAISILSHEFFKNNNANAYTGKQYDPIHPFYHKLLNLINHNVPGLAKLVHEIRKVMAARAKKTKSTINLYNQLADQVIYYVLTRADKPLPPNYKRD